MVGQHGMAFLDLAKSFCGWSPLLVQHEKIEKQFKGFGLTNIHLYKKIALIEILLNCTKLTFN